MDLIINILCFVLLMGCGTFLAVAILRQRKEIVNRNERIAVLHRQIAKRDKLVDQLRSECVCLRKDSAEQINSQHEKIVTLRKQVFERDEWIDALRNEIDNLREKYKSLCGLAQDLLGAE
jgi:uncharacterized coiled-coil protein SlyX